MGFFNAWRNWRQFKAQDWDWRNVVVYSESGQDWHQFEGLIAEISHHHKRKISYVTSDSADPGLDFKHANFRSFLIPEGLSRTIFFQVKQADVCVLTMMDLDNLQLRRSLHPVHYIYLFHSMGSTHMVDHENSFDHYDTLFCAGPHQQKEIRRREALKNLPAKDLYDYGHPRLEQVMALKDKDSVAAPLPESPQVLVAPTWGEESIFNLCGEALIKILLDNGFRVIMRPHYHSKRLTPDLIDRLRRQFQDRNEFEYVDQMGETDSLLRSHLLISDWSGMALEYALGLEKPVLFIDVPRRIRNPNWEQLGIEPMESAIRRSVGRVLSPDELAKAPQLIRELLAEPDAFADSIRQLRETVVYRLGHSIPDGAARIVELADRQREARIQRKAAQVQ